MLDIFLRAYWYPVWKTDWKNVYSDPLPVFLTVFSLGNAWVLCIF